jgi:hypothetical protein
VRITRVTDGVCVLKQVWSNKRVTVFREGRPLRRLNDFEGRPPPGCVRPRFGEIRREMRMWITYPDMRRGDRVCYRFPYHLAGRRGWFTAGHCLKL